jgi:hypothetical protein
MTVQTVVNAAVQKRSDVAWWAYLPAALVSGFFALMGWGEGGISGAALFILLLGLCVVQWVYPTLLMWGLLLSLFSAYAVAVVVTPHNGTFADYMFFFFCGAVPAVLLLFGKPKKKNAGSAE